jgi:hypothetical protein
MTIVGTGLCLVARGHGSARWLLAAAFAAVGLLSAAVGLAMLLVDSTNPQTSRAVMQTLVAIVTALFFIGAAAALFASDALDELCGSRRYLSGPSSWESVSAPESRAFSPTARGLLDPAQVFLRRRWGTIGGWISTGAAAVAWIGFLVAAVWLWRTGLQELESTKQMQSSSIQLLAVLSVFVYVSTVVGYVGYLIAAYLVLFMAALLLVLPIALRLVLKWKHPARFLILRPFNRAHISRTLRQVLCRELAPLGHCYTLADAHIRVPLWLRLPLFLGQLSFFAFRQRKIVAPRDISKLVRAIDRRALRNFNWCVSRDKVFPIACIDAGWRACVARLVAECDCVVMDLSGISGNILWELELLKRTQALERAVFLVDANQYAGARAALYRLLDGASVVPPLLSYNVRGLVEADSLTAAAVHALRGKS